MDEEIDRSYPRYVYSEQFPKGQLIHSEAEFLNLEGSHFAHPSLKEESRVAGKKAEPKADKAKRELKPDESK